MYLEKTNLFLINATPKINERNNINAPGSMGTLLLSHPDPSHHHGGFGV